MSSWSLTLSDTSMLPLPTGQVYPRAAPETTWGMTSPKTYLGRKAVKATVRHSVRGTVSKARREPPRTLTLLGLGAIAGAVAGWLAGSARSRSGAAVPEPQVGYSIPQPQPGSTPVAA